MRNRNICSLLDKRQTFAGETVTDFEQLLQSAKEQIVIMGNG
jgi:hypothetical protein